MTAATLPVHTASERTPEGWEVLPIRAACKLINGRGFKPHEWQKVGLPIIRIQNLNGSETFNFYDGQYNPKILVEHGQLLFAWSGSRGTSFGPHVWKGQRALLNYHTWKVDVNESRICRDFLLHALRQLTSYIEDRAHGASALVHTQKWEMEKFPILVPSSTREQKAIAAALSDVDTLLGALDRLIAKKRDLKQAAMQQLLTGQTRLPGFSGKWETKRLGDHVAFLRNGTHSRAELDEAGPLRYLHYGDIHIASSCVLDAERVAMPRLPEAKGRTLDRLESGDVVFVDASEDLAGIGKAVELRLPQGMEVVAGLHTIAARFDKIALADGFKAYLQFVPAFRKHLTRLAAGTKVYATSRRHIADVAMALPAAAEQLAIARVLVDMDAELSALEHRRDKTRLLKQGMMQELLTGRTRLV